jgi:predicted transcriptional regulator
VTKDSNVPTSLHTVLSRRERQIMDILYQLGKATAADLMKALPGDPSDSTVRTQLRVLETKGHVRHEEDGTKYVYFPVVPRRVVRKSALKHVVNTFFDGSAEKVVAALLGPDGGRLSDDELDRIADMVARARAEESK